MDRSLLYFLLNYKIPRTLQRWACTRAIGTQHCPGLVRQPDVRRRHARQQHTRVALHTRQRMELCERRVRGVVFVLSGLVKPARRELQDPFLPLSQFGVVGVVRNVDVVHTERNVLVEEGTALAAALPTESYRV